MRFDIIWIILGSMNSFNGRNYPSLIFLLLAEFTKVLKILAEFRLFTEKPNRKQTFLQSGIRKERHLTKSFCQGHFKSNSIITSTLRMAHTKKWHMLRLENSNKIRCVTAKLLFSMASMRERWRLIFAAKADDTHCMC